VSFAPRIVRTIEPIRGRAVGRASAVLAVCAGALGLGAGPAFGSGFSAAEFGGEHGNVVTTEPTALYFNPAGIALSSGTHLYGSGILGLRRGHWIHPKAPSEMADPSSAAGEDPDAGEARFSNVLAAPALAATTWLGRVALGAAFYVPFGGRVHWDSNPHFANSPLYPQAVDGIQRWHVIDGSLQSVYFTLGAAVRLGPVSLGVTGNLVRSAVYLRQAKSFSAMPVDPTNEGRITLDVAGWQPSLGLGAMVEAIPERLWIGASYQTQPGFGPIELDGTLTISDSTGAAAARPVTYHSALPDIVRLGVRVRALGGLHPLELRAYGDLTRWSRLQTQCVSVRGQPCAVYADGGDATSGATTVENLRRLWSDTTGAMVAASYWMWPDVEVFAGVGYATAAPPDATLDPVLTDATNVRFTVGGRVALPARLHLTAGLTDVQYASRDNTGRSTLSDAQLPTRRADGGGQYELWLGILQVAIEGEL
jgi:long-chain fatty acid transport protein